MADGDTSGLMTAYGAFIYRYQWDWWCHLTFENDPCHDRAMRAFNAWTNEVNRKVFGKNYAKRGQGIRWVRGTETHKLGGLHFHVLVADCQESHTDVGKSLWQKIGGDAKIDVYDIHKNAAYYVAKIHALGGDLDFGGPWPPLDLSEISQLSALR